MHRPLLVYMKAKKIILRIGKRCYLNEQMSYQAQNHQFIIDKFILYHDFLFWH